MQRFSSLSVVIRSAGSEAKGSLALKTQPLPERSERNLLCCAGRVQYWTFGLVGHLGMDRDDVDRFLGRYYYYIVGVVTDNVEICNTNNDPVSVLMMISRLGLSG